MPSTLHEILLELFLADPAAAARRILAWLDLPAPPYRDVQVERTSLGELLPLDLRADGVLRLVGPQGRAALCLVVEVQLKVDPDKGYSWPAYLTAARARYRCRAEVVVVAPDPAVAAWARRPVSLSYENSFRPLVLGPEQIPLVTDAGAAAAAPEEALLSVLAHARGPSGAARETLLAAAQALPTLDDELGMVYWDLIQGALPGALRAWLEEQMQLEGYQWQSEWFLRHRAEGFAEGRADAVLRLLAARGVAVSEAERQRILSCRDLGQLDRWFDRALEAEDISELFE